MIADLVIGPVSTASDLEVFWRSLALVGVAELFDKTWFMGLLLALRYSPRVVFAGSFTALFLHCFFAAAFGLAFARLVPQSVLNFLAAGLFAFFAVLYAKDWYQADPNNDAIAAGREEAEQDCGLRHSSTSDDAGCAENDVSTQQVIGKSVAGQREPKFFPPDADAEEDDFWKGDTVDQKEVDTETEELQLVPDPEAGNADRDPDDAEEKAVVADEDAARTSDCRVAYTKSFIGVFIAEWGDRTQIAMIGQHASQPLIPVFIGSAIAFFLLTLSAVGLASVANKLKLSERTVHGLGALSFGLFAVLALKDSLDALGVEDLHGAGGNTTAVKTMARIARP